MKNEILKKIINIWDPYGVFGLAPKDEYDLICRDIIIILDRNQDNDIELKRELSDYLKHIYFREPYLNRKY